MPLLFTICTTALCKKGMGHQVVYQPFGELLSIENLHVRTSYFPRPEPKNSPIGASPVFCPSNETCNLAPSSTALAFATVWGSTGQLKCLTPCQVGAAIV